MTHDTSSLPRDALPESGADVQAAIARVQKETIGKDQLLQRTQRVLAALFESMRHTAIVFDRDLRIQMVNRPFPEGCPCHEILFKQPEPCAECDLPMVAQSKVKTVSEKKIGSDYYEIHHHPIVTQEGAFDGVLEVCKNITRYKDLEQQLLHADRLSSIGQLVSGIVHEINNPTMFILGNLDVIQEAMKDVLPILDRHAQENADFTVARLRYDFFKEHMNIMLQDMIDGANRIKFIIGNLKRLARRDEGVLGDEVDLNCVVSECLRLGENQMRRMASIHTELEEDLPSVLGNRQKLIQVVVNLLINAAQAIEKRMPDRAQKGNIWVRTKSLKDQTQIVLEIADDGCGMDEYAKQRIFTPFFTTKRETGGTGLGLSIASRIIREHAGRIDWKSEQGQGTTFTISLPFRSKHEEQDPHHR